MSDSVWVAIVGLILVNGWQLLDRVKKHAAFEATISQSLSDHAQAIAALTERMKSIEDFLRNHAERRRDPADLVRLARLMAQQSPDPAVGKLIGGILDRYEPK